MNQTSDQREQVSNQTADPLPPEQVEKFERLKKLMEKGREFGLVYKFDVCGILSKNARDLKWSGSNGKAKGFQHAAELVGNLPAVKNAVVVTRCEECMSYNAERTWCGKHACPFPPDGYCSHPDKKPSEQPVIASR